MRRLAVFLLLTACVQGRKPRPHADAGPTAPSAPSVLAAPTTPPTALSSEPPSPSVAATPVVAGADRVALERAKQVLSHINTMVAHHSLTIPDKPEEGDATMKCTTIDELRPRLEASPDPEAASVLESANRVCSFDVPLLSARAALDQAGHSPSQASRALVCKLASRDIAKARAVKADDKRVRDTDARYKRICNR